MSDREENTDAAQERERRQEALGDVLRTVVRTFGVDPRVIGRWRNAPLPGSHLSPAQIADDGRYLGVLLARLRAIVAMSYPGSPPADHLMGLPFEDLQAQRREELRARTLAAEEAARLQAAHPAAEIEAALTRDRPDRKRGADYSADAEMLARLHHALTQRAHAKICNSELAQLWLSTTQPVLGYRRPLEYCTNIRTLDECLELLEVAAERRLASQ
jgi:Protein of unknown function (DUF2384)